MKVTMIGAGNLATQLSKTLYENGIEINQIFSRTENSAKELAEQFSCAYTTDITKIESGSDFYIYAVKDDILPTLIEQNPITDGIHIHTAGSVDVNVFYEKKKNYGVFYPMQTFTKAKRVNFKTIPVFIEGSSDDVLNQIKTLASNVSDNISVCNSKGRKSLHIAAVFCCNFTNCLFAIADEILKENGVDVFEKMFPLIKETTDNLQNRNPHDIQTGPAKRKDFSVMEMHKNMLKSHPKYQELYNMLSEIIMQQQHS